MILIDANIFMYAAGSPHPNKAPSVDLLDRVADGRVQAAADVEVLQEILHRYRAIGRWEDGRRVYDLARQVITTWLAIDVDTLDVARELMDRVTGLGARDALHAAAVLRAGAEGFCSFDRDFDYIPGVQRVEPGDL